MITTFLANVHKVNITLERDGKTRIRVFWNEDNCLNHYDLDLLPKNREGQVLIETCGIKIK